MKFYTEFIVMHGDEPMPDAKTFMPSFWKADDLDSDGDFYADSLDGRWTNLQLTKRRTDGCDSVLSVNTFRETRLYDPGVQEVADLQRYLDFHKAGRYDRVAAISDLSSLAVTSLAIETPNQADYREFLETVDAFLEHSGGVLVSPWEADQSSFRKEFLCDAG